jgi:UDP-N-acetylglucosamine 4,6-dehydratase
LLGADLASRIASARPRQLLLFDRNESALYYLEVDFLRRLAMVPLTPLVGDILDDQRLRQVLQTFRPDLVIHAAAYAGDMLVSTNGDEIRRNNLLGVGRVLSAAADFGVERLLVLSTDEARSDGLACVHRAAEYLLRSQPRASSAVYAAVRLPSVVGSPACEVTKIARSLQRGLPVVVPSSDARARIVTRRTVSPLLLEAFALAADGDVLAIDAGEIQSCGEVARYLRRVWNLPEAPIESSTVLPEHIHPLEVGTPTRHPNILRRELATPPPPCVTAMLHDLDFEPEVERFAQLS